MIGIAIECISWLSQQKTDVKFEVTEYHPKRSLSANAYAWALINKIADALRKSKEEIYLQMLKDYGQSEFVSVLSNINVKGYFKYYEEYGRGHVEGREFTHYKVYKGSSEMNSKEMAILIDGIVQEAKALDIETRTPAEIDEMIRLMEQK